MSNYGPGPEYLAPGEEGLWFCNACGRALRNVGEPTFPCPHCGNPPKPPGPDGPDDFVANQEVKSLESEIWMDFPAPEDVPDPKRGGSGNMYIADDICPKCGVDTFLYLMKQTGKGIVAGIILGKMRGVCPSCGANMREEQ